MSIGICFSVMQILSLSYIPYNFTVTITMVRNWFDSCATAHFKAFLQRKNIFAPGSSVKAFIGTLANVMSGFLIHFQMLDSLTKLNSLFHCQWPTHRPMGCVAEPFGLWGWDLGLMTWIWDWWKDMGFEEGVWGTRLRLGSLDWDMVL